MKARVVILGPRYVSIFFSMIFHAYCGNNDQILRKTRITTTFTKFWPLRYFVFLWSFMLSFNQFTLGTWWVHRGQDSIQISYKSDQYYGCYVQWKAGEREFSIFRKKHWPSPELWISRMGQIFVFWKKSDASFGSSDASDFFSFLIFTFSILIHNSAQGWFDSNFHLNSFSAQNSFPFSPEGVWKLYVWWFLSQGLM